MANPASSSSSVASASASATTSLPHHLLSSIIPGSLYSSTCSNPSDHTDPHERLSSTMVQLPSASIRALLEACRNIEWQQNLNELRDQAPIRDNEGNRTREKLPDVREVRTEGSTRSEVNDAHIDDEQERPRQSVAQAVKALEAKNPHHERNSPSIRSSRSGDSLGQRDRTSSTSTTSFDPDPSSSSSSLEITSKHFNARNEDQNAKGKQRDRKENAFDLCCLSQRSMDVVSGLANSKNVNLVLGRVLFDSLEEEMQPRTTPGAQGPEDASDQVQHLNHEQASRDEEEDADDRGRDEQNGAIYLNDNSAAISKRKGKEKKLAEITGDNRLQESKDFVRNGLSICVVAEEEAVFFGLTHALSTVVSSSDPNSTVLLRMRVPSTSTASLLAEVPLAPSADGEEVQNVRSITFEIIEIPSEISDATSSEDILSSNETMKTILNRLEGSLKTELSSFSETEYLKDSATSPRIYHFSFPFKSPPSLTKTQGSSSPTSSPMAAIATSSEHSTFLPKSLSELSNSPDKITTDPTLDILISFVLSHLKRHSIALHSRNGSLFAEELTQELLSWGCDVARFPILTDKRRINSLSPEGSRVDEVGLNGLSAEEVEEMLNQDLSSASNQKTTSHSNSSHPEWQRSNAFFVTRSNSNPSVGQSREVTKNQSSDQKTPRSAAAISGKDGRPGLVSFPSDLKLNADEIVGKEGSSNELRDQKIRLSRSVLDPVTGVPFTTSLDSKGSSSRKTVGTRTSSDSLNESFDPSSNLVPFSYVLIDDDLETLQQELLRLRSAILLLRSAVGGASHPHSSTTQIESDVSSKTDYTTRRPPLQHRPRSSPQIQKVLSLEAQSNQQVGNKRVSNQNRGHSDWSLTSSTGNINENQNSSSHQSPLDESTCAIIYMTSISQYHQISEVLISVMSTASTPATFDEKSGELKHSRLDLPQILVIPKPAGSRRILTTMHSAVLRPKFDPLYQPLAVHDVVGSNVAATADSARMEGIKDSPISSMPSSPAPMIGTPKAVYEVDRPQLTSLTSEALKDYQQQRERHSKANQNDTLPRFKVQAASAKDPVELSVPVPSEQAASSSMDITPPNISAASSGAVSSPSIAAPTSVAASGAGSHIAGSSSTGAVGVLSPARSSVPSSPMPVDALEYFTETAAKMGNSAASGMVIQSPDGRPAGIFFRPQNTKHIANGSSRSLNPGASGSGAAIKRSSSETGAALLNASEAIQSDQANGGEGHRPEGVSSTSEALLHPQPLSSSLKGENASNNNPPSSRLTRSRTSSSVVNSDTTGTAASSSSPRTGSLFSPQIAIESVLSGSQPPVTTPLSLAFRGGGASSNSSSAQTSFSNSPLPPSPKTNSAHDSGTQPPEDVKDAKGAHHQQGADTCLQVPERDGPSSDVPKKRSLEGQIDEDGGTGRTQSSSSGNTPKVPDGGQDETSQTQLNGPQIPISTHQPNTRNTDAEEEKALSNKQAKLSLLAPSSQARQSFAAGASAQAANGIMAPRPSAMPQSGLLIGAGFTPKSQSRGGPKKAPVREVILPPIKVLIVEDNPINQRILTMFMGKKKINYEVANNGREAVDKWQTGGFHLILMDIQLPVMDGIEATKEIRKLERVGNIGILPGTPPTSSIASLSPHSRREEWLPPDSVPSNAPSNPAPFRPSVIIVALTASVFNSDRVAALAAGCNDFLNKPVSHAWLEKKIIEWGSMQYILLAGFDHHGFSQNLGASKAIASAVANGPRPTANSSANVNSKPHQHPNSNSNGRAALFAAMNNSEIQENFGNAPDKKAHEMAGKLHINPGRKSKGSSSGFSTGSTD